VLVDADDTIDLVTVWLPEGFTARSEAKGAAQSMLQKAQGQMNLSHLLAEDARQQKALLPEKQILAAQRQFHDWLRRADYEAGVEGKRKNKPEHTQALRDAIKDLRAQNQRLARGQYEHLASEKQASPAEAASHDDGRPALRLPERGLPLVYSVGQAVREPLLRATSTSDVRFSVVASQLLLVGFVALLILSTMPRLLRKIPLFWPEQLMGLALVGTLMLGPSLVGLGLFLAGLAGRLAWIMLGLVRLYQRWFFVTAPAQS
jgi:hypothetical protein